MKYILFALLVLCAVPAAAQSKLYTNADLVPASAPILPRTMPAEELRGFLARQYVYIPLGPRESTVVVIGNTQEGPFGFFAPPTPDRRLDGSLRILPPDSAYAWGWNGPRRATRPVRRASSPSSAGRIPARERGTASGRD